MAKVYDKIDYFFSDDGDYAIGPDGDILDTSFDTLRSIRQEIMTRLQSDRGDWKLNEGIGADLSTLVGQPNTARTGQAIKNAILNALLYNALVETGDVRIQVVPLSANVVAVKLQLNAIRTRENSNSSPVTINFVYDYADNNVYPIYHEPSGA